MTAPWRDTPERYGRVTRLLHWGMALILLWQFTGMILRLILGRTPLMAFWVGTHQSVGTVLLALILLRLAWAWVNRGMRPAQPRTAAGRAARLGHAALYALLAIVPALSLLRAFGNGRGYAFFGHQVVPRSGVRIEWMSAPADLLHAKLAWLLLALILGHVAMALLHHFAWRDGVLKRMAGRVPPGAGPSPGPRAKAAGAVRGG